MVGSTTRGEVIPGATIDRYARAAAGRRWVWALLIAALAAWPFVHSLRTRVPPPPPVLGTAPSFQLVGQDERPFGSEDLAGRVWVGGLVSTRREAGCPAVTREMARIQARARNLEPALHLVSFSVDPDHDTPARLAEYARAHRASPRMWTFATGSADTVRATVEGLGVGAACGAAAAGGPSLVLVDGAARVRRHYDLRDPDAADRVVRDAALLVNRREPPRSAQ